jgi:chromosome segregation ATPase
MPQDDLDFIPSIVPTRDGEPQLTPARPRSNVNERNLKNGRRQRDEKTGGAGWLSRLFIAVALLVAAAACGWAWQLQARLQHADEQLANYATRIGDLESRLSDTDEGMNQSAETQAAKLGKLDAEVRTLWNNVSKESKDRFTKLETTSASQDKSIKGVEASVASTQAQLKDATAEIANLKSVSGDLARLMTSAKANQAEVERIADSLNRIELSLAKLDKRVAGNEDWVGSVNAFRKQVNTSLSEIQATIRSMQAPSK